jgi:hypothetical protein
MVVECMRDVFPSTTMNRIQKSNKKFFVGKKPRTLENRARRVGYREEGWYGCARYIKCHLSQLTDFKLDQYTQKVGKGRKTTKQKKKFK